MVTSRKRKLNQDDAQETDIKTIDPSDFTYILINAVKQQQHTIEQQNVRIEALERRTTPMTSSGVPRNLGWAALGLLPVGIFIGRRRQSRSAPTARRD
jgi:hypothetical protein